MHDYVRDNCSDLHKKSTKGQLLLLVCVMVVVMIVKEM